VNASYATLGGGCFWCLEAVFVRIDGVLSVESGYAGGRTPNPTYHEVCRGRTGHAEVVRVGFDPEAITFREILEIFFAIHDPTTPDRQGADRGPQYRSIILVETEEQAEQARALIGKLEADELWDDPVVTEVRALERFYPAEDEHHRYFERNPHQSYCRLVVTPKVRIARQRFAHRFRED
jgi:peptide-methionine (S)-S-oxide reductase